MSVRNNAKFLLLFSFLTLFAGRFVTFSAEAAAESAEAYVAEAPGELKSWIPWVVAQHPEWNCARVPGVDRAGARACIWIGSSRFVIRDRQTEFYIQGDLLKDDSIPLPFSGNMRPSNLKILKDGIATERYLIEESPGELALRLDRGTYAISGELLYNTVPDRIPVPAVYGIVDITVSDQLAGQKEGLIRAYRDNNSIRIVSHSEGTGSDSAEGRLWRSVVDDNPLQIRTRIELQISGKPRTIVLGTVLPVGAILTGSDSASQIAFSDAGELSVQVFQGRHEIELMSVLAQPVNEIKLPENSAKVLPDEEIWTWEANARLRTVEIDNARTLNAAQVELPKGWSAQTVLGVTQGASVVLKELRRGQEVPPKNEVTLNRMIWPKLAGAGFVVEDSFSGVMNSGFRLNALPEMNLGSASVNGAPVPVTVDPQNKALGVELRTQQLTLKAVSEVPTSQLFSAEISSAGWEGTFENIRLNLAIPLSWKAIHLSNVTTQSGSWTSRWSIFDLFLLLVLTAFSVRIFGARVGYIFLAFALMGKGEFMMPAIFYGWTLFFAACSLPLTERSYPILRLACAAGFGSSLIAFLMQGLIFSKLQLIQAIHPQLQAGTRYRTFTQELLTLVSASPYLWPAIVYGIITGVLLLIWVSKGKLLIEKFGRLIAAGIAFFILSSIATAGVAMLTNFAPQPSDIDIAKNRWHELRLREIAKSDSGGGYDSNQSYDLLRRRAAPVRAAAGTDRLLQSGPSLPQWRWRSVLATVAGPVSSDHRITIYMVPESFERIACIVRLLLTMALACALIVSILKSFRGSFSGLGGRVASTAVAVLLLLLPLQSARADFPSADLLNQLEQRLEKEQCVSGVCTSIDSISLDMNQDIFTIEMKVRSNGIGAVSVPGPIFELVPARVTVDGRESVASRLSGRYLQVKVPDGAHTISVTGQLEPSASLAISIPEKPLRFLHRLTGWELSAPLAAGSVPDEIRLVRQSDPLGGKDVAESRKGVVPTRNVFQVVRSLVVDERITVQAEIRRIGDATKAVVARIPLQAGESVSTSNWPVEEGALVVNFGPGESSASFVSLIAPGKQFTLHAAADETIFEQWNIRCKDYVQCQANGIAPTYRAVNGEAALLFLPFRDESVSVETLLLESAKGNFVTIDSIAHSNSWGETTLKGQIDLAVRATRQAPLVLSFSDPALTIEMAMINGNPDTRKFSPQNVSLLLESGTHRVSVQYTRPFTPGFSEYVPQVKLNYPAGNITTIVKPAPARWILWLGGSSWGPAVIFWSKLLAALTILAGLKLWGGLAISWFAVAVLALGVSFLPTMLQPVPVCWVLVLSSVRVREILNRFLGVRQRQVFISLLAAASLVLIYLIIRGGLLQEPPSLITGNGSSATMLRWFNDFITFSDSAELPRPWVISLPLAGWRAITLLLSVALVFLGLRWIRATVNLVKED